MLHLVRYILLYIIFGIIFIIPNVVYAQSESDSNKVIRYEDLKETTIRDKQVSQQMNGHTLDFEYVGKNALLKNQGNTFINTLEKLAGISAIHTGVGISKPVIRGLSLNRVIVNEYGIKQEGQQWGVDHGLEIDQFNVDRVEVLKGPVSVLYGTDGIGGVINILPPIIPPKNTFSGNVISQYKSNNDLFSGSVQLLFNKNDVFSIIRASKHEYGSYKVPSDSFVYNSYVLPIYNNRLKNTGGKEFSASLLQGIRRSWGQTSFYFSMFQQEAGFFVGAFGPPRAYQLLPESNNRKIALPKQTIRHYKFISNTHIHLPKGRLELDAGFQLNNRNEYAKPHIGGSFINDFSDEALGLDLITYNFNVRYTIEKRKYQLIVGSANMLQHNNISGYEFLIPNYKMHQIGVFGFGEYKWNDHILSTAGLRFDYAQQNVAATSIGIMDSLGNILGYNLRNDALNKNYKNFTFSFGTLFHKSHHEQYKFNIGTAYRIPAVVELAANGMHHGTFRHELGNSNLNSEKGMMVDVAYYFHKGKWSIQATPFVNYFTNYIYLNPSGRFSNLPEAGQVYQYANDPAVFTGFESYIKYDVTNTLQLDNAIEYVWNQNLNRKTGLPFTPPFSWLHELEWKPFINLSNWQHFYFQVSGQLFAAQNNTAANEPNTAGYYVVNAGTGIQYLIGPTRIHLMLQLRNAFNAVYYNNMSRYRILNLPEQGRNAQVMLRFEF